MLGIAVQYDVHNTAQYSTHRDKLLPYSWVGTTLLKSITIFIDHIWAHLRRDNWYLMVLPSKPKMKLRKSWRKQCAVKIVFQVIFLPQKTIQIFWYKISKNAKTACNCELQISNTFLFTNYLFGVLKTE